MVLDDVAHFVRDQIPDGLAFGNSLADFRGGNIDAALVEGDVGMGGPIGAAREDDPLHEVMELIDAAPGVELGQVILADEVKEIGPGIDGVQVQEGIDGVGCAAAEDFDFVDFKAGLSFDGGANHCGAQLRRRDGAAELVRGAVIGDEDELVEIEGIEGIAAEDEMPEVDGIERAADDAYFHADQ
jgi:hypothetical protein